MHFIAVINRSGGTLRTMDLDAFCDMAKSAFERHGHTLDCAIVSGKQVEARLRQAAATEGVDAVIAAGGTARFQRRQLSPLKPACRSECCLREP